MSLPTRLTSWTNNSLRRIHEWAYDGLISMSDITELELGPSENSYSRGRQMSVIVVLEVSVNHTGGLETKRCTAYGRRGLFVQLVVHI